MKKVLLTGLIFIAISIIFSIEFSDRIIIDSEFSGYWTIAGDVDRDGDMDILGCDFIEHNVYWWVNNGYLDFSERITLKENFYDPFCIFLGDVDDDQDNDILIASRYMGDIIWLINDGNNNFDTEIDVDTLFPGAISVTAKDINGDNHLEVFASAMQGNMVAWYSNNGEEDFDRTILNSGFIEANSIWLADLNGDNNDDIISCARGNDKVGYWLNNGDYSFEDNVTLIDSLFDKAINISSADFDHNGYSDIVGAAMDGNEIAVWMNNDLDFTKITLQDNFYEAVSVYPADMNNDGYDDILCTSRYLGDIKLWINDGNGNFLESQNIDTTFSGAVCVYAEDIDDDGYNDVLGSGWYLPQLAWWRNELGTDNEDLSSVSPSVTHYPNPFNPELTISLNIKEIQIINLNIYNLKGQKVRTLIDNEKISGENKIIWDGKSDSGRILSSGVYLYKLEMGNKAITKKCILLK